jgi:hypothetical protein
MSVWNPTPDDSLEEGTLEECLEEINDFVATLRRYPPTVIAVALRAHLEALLRALAEAGLCSRRELKEFVRELEREALQRDDD